LHGDRVRAAADNASTFIGSLKESTDKTPIVPIKIESTSRWECSAWSCSISSSYESHIVRHIKTDHPINRGEWPLAESAVCEICLNHIKCTCLTKHQQACSKDVFNSNKDLLLAAAHSAKISLKRSGVLAAKDRAALVLGFMRKTPAQWKDEEAEAAASRCWDEKLSVIRQEQMVIADAVEGHWLRPLYSTSTSTSSNSCQSVAIPLPLWPAQGKPVLTSSEASASSAAAAAAGAAETKWPKSELEVKKKNKKQDSDLVLEMDPDGWTMMLCSGQADCDGCAYQEDQDKRINMFDTVLSTVLKKSWQQPLQLLVHQVVERGFWTLPAVGIAPPTRLRLRSTHGMPLEPGRRLTLHDLDLCCCRACVLGTPLGPIESFLDGVARERFASLQWLGKVNHRYGLLDRPGSIDASGSDLKSSSPLCDLPGLGLLLPGNENKRMPAMKSRQGVIFMPGLDRLAADEQEIELPVGSWLLLFCLFASAYLAVLSDFGANAGLVEFILMIRCRNEFVAASGLRCRTGTGARARQRDTL
jgi:hypothetical protein